jgi:chemotaxis signal transduction protein
MTGPASSLNTVTELRDAFDRMFTMARQCEGSAPSENLILTRVSGHPYALKVSEIAGIVTDRKTIAIPSRASELLGVAAIRGGFVPMYSLAALLGYPAEEGRARVHVLCRSEELIGLALSSFEGYHRVSATEIYLAERDKASRARANQVVRISETVRAIIDIPYLLQVIGKRCAANAAEEGR